MNTCDLIIEWLDDYLDGTLSNENLLVFEAHLDGCENCQSLVTDLQSMREVLSEMPLVALPTDFNESLHQKLVMAAEEMKKASTSDDHHKQSKKYNKLIPFPSKRIMPYVGLAAAFAIFVGAGSQLQNALWWNQGSEVASFDAAGSMNRSIPESSANMAGAEAPVTATYDLSSEGASVASGGVNTDSGVANAKSAPQVTFTDGSSVQTSTPVLANSGRDLIRTGDISLKVGRIDQFTLDLQALIESAGGYIESSFTAVSPYYQNEKEAGTQLGASIVLRIPSDQFVAVFDGIKKMGELNSAQQGVQDITSQLSDLKASLSNLEVREKRLQALMNEAKNVTEVMAVEKELSAVRTQIDQIAGQIKLQSQQVSLSTLYISVQENPEIANQFKAIDGNLWQQAVSALVRNINKAVVMLEKVFVFAVSWFPAVVVAILGYLGIKQTKTYKNWRIKK